MPDDPTARAVAQALTVEARIGLRSLLVGPFIAKEKDIVAHFTVPGRAVSKARARIDRRTGRLYTPEETVMREEDIRAAARGAHRQLVVDTMGLFSLRAGFYLETNQRRDTDNLLKLVSDALTGVIWLDDSQVAEMFAFKIPADRPREARTEVAVIRLSGMMPYQFGRCAICQRQFRTYPSWRYRLCCSRRCWLLLVGSRVPRVCQHCGQTFEVQAGDNHRRFCSSACRYACWGEARICGQCGTTFRAKRSAAKLTCSRACASVRRKNLAAEVRLVQSTVGSDCGAGRG